MSDKPILEFSAIAQRIREAELPACDAVIGILTGGLVPASLIAFHLRVPLYIITLNYRSPGDHSPRHPNPVLLAELPDIPATVSHVLLVDDVGVSGSTLKTAASLFPNLKTTTLVVKGQADLVLFPEIRGCVRWSWNP